MANSFKKIIELINKTGDNCIVVDQEGEPAYVVMTFADYEKMILGKSEVASLTEGELVEKINRDVAIWKAAQEVESLDNWQEIESAIDEIKKSKEEEENSLSQAKNTEEESNSGEKYYFEPID